MLYALDPAMPVLLRPDGAVQVGWDPRRAVLVHPPDGATPTAVAAVLRGMHNPLGKPELHRLAAAHGLAGIVVEQILQALLTSGVARGRARQSAARALSIRVHGRGPLADILVETLRCSGARIAHTSHTNVSVTAANADVVVLSDSLMADPRLLRDLHLAGVPHLPVRVRDGAGLVGPLVIPGVTSCLACADLHRTDRDSAWPAVAAQLRDVIGNADRPTVLATAAVAVSQLQRIITAVRGQEPAGAPPMTLNTTLQIDVTSNTITARHWSRHPNCQC